MGEGRCLCVCLCVAGEALWLSPRCVDSQKLIPVAEAAAQFLRPTLRYYALLLRIGRLKDGRACFLPLWEKQAMEVDSFGWVKIVVWWHCDFVWRMQSPLTPRLGAPVCLQNQCTQADAA